MKMVADENELPAMRWPKTLHSRMQTYGTSVERGAVHRQQVRPHDRHQLSTLKVPMRYSAQYARNLQT